VRYRRSDVVERALEVLDRYGLADLSMRRLAADLGVAPSALYHHVANKQALLAAVADEILARGRRPRRTTAWDSLVVETCEELRDAMLAYRDGAEVVATVHAFGLGAAGPGEQLDEVLLAAGLPEGLARAASRTLLHYVFGHAADEQTTLQANSAGAIDRLPRDSADFGVGLGIILDGLRTHLDDGARQLGQQHRA
jgi:TetR/AcrR family tetracycline transcriptional repressor